MSVSSVASAAHHDDHTTSKISYDHASVSYKTLSVDGADEDFKGLNLGLQKKVFDSNFFIELEYSKMTMDTELFEIDSTEKLVGLGYGYTINPDFAIDAEFGLVESEAEVGGFKGSEDGHYFGAKAHYMLHADVEGYAGVKSFKYSGASDSFSEVKIGAKYIINDKFDVFAEYNSYDSNNGLELGVSYRL